MVGGGEMLVLVFTDLVGAAFLGLTALAAGAAALAGFSAVDGGSVAGCFAAVCLLAVLAFVAVLAAGVLLGARLVATLPWVKPTWRAENPRPVACSSMGA